MLAQKSQPTQASTGSYQSMLRSTLVEINNCQTEKDLLAVTQGIKTVLVNLPGLNQGSNLAEELTALSARLEGSKAERMSKMATLVRQLEASADLDKQKSFLGDILSLLGEEVGVKMPKPKRGLCGQSIACNVACVAATTVAATGITLATLFMAGAMGDEVLSAEVEGEADDVAAETEVEAEEAAAQTGEAQQPPADSVDEPYLTKKFGAKRAERMLTFVKQHEDLAREVLGDDSYEVHAETGEKETLFQRNVEMIFKVARRFDTDSEFVRWNMFKDSAFDEVEIINFEEMRNDISEEIEEYHEYVVQHYKDQFWTPVDPQVFPDADGNGGSVTEADGATVSKKELKEVHDYFYDEASWRDEFFPEDANADTKETLKKLYGDLADKNKPMTEIREMYTLEDMKSLMGITGATDGNTGFRAADYLVSWSDTHELGDEKESPVTFAIEMWSLGQKPDAELVEELRPYIKAEYQEKVDSIDDILVNMEDEMRRDDTFDKAMDAFDKQQSDARAKLKDEQTTLQSIAKRLKSMREGKVLSMEAGNARDAAYEETMADLKEELRTAKAEFFESRTETRTDIKGIKMRQLEADMNYNIKHLNDAEIEREVDRTAQRMFKVMRMVMKNELEEANIDHASRTLKAADQERFLELANSFFVNKGYEGDDAVLQSDHLLPNEDEEVDDLLQS